ncbi:hypothetical protein [Microcoleus sp. CAWBG58]|uniref:hypothetical protein n=1 Tax=Microcoleus sp. CAWBG58 TaxID=2841651 RepID=UPI0025FB7901|nr:hypothetical protein [Microcoleus sp. CAWBG58]
MKASPFEGEIKIRLFIIPILFLLGRGYYQNEEGGHGAPPLQLSTVENLARRSATTNQTT